MKFHHHPLHMHAMLLTCCLAAAYPTANAAETDTSTTTTTATSTTVGASQNTEAKLVTEFAYFLGGEEQARTVISGLRQGSSFELVTETTTETTTGTGTGSEPPSGTTTETTAGTGSGSELPTGTTTETTTGTTITTTTTTTIDPPTGTMGYGNIRIALRMAQSELAKLGITEATPEQLSAILLGGEIDGSQVNGILAMRAEGMGWGQIAHNYDMTVGQLMGKGSGLTKQTTSSSQVKSNGYIASGKPVGAGIVNGMGSTMSSSGNGKGQANKAANAQGGGNAGAGKSFSMAGVSNAGGGGNATAPGQLKKN